MRDIRDGVMVLFFFLWVLVQQRNWQMLSKDPLQERMGFYAPPCRLCGSMQHVCPVRRELVVFQPHDRSAPKFGRVVRIAEDDCGFCMTISKRKKWSPLEPLGVAWSRLEAVEVCCEQTLVQVTSDCLAAWVPVPCEDLGELALPEHWSFPM